MRFLDLCAGIGGFSLGLEIAGMKCEGQVEIDEWCNKILAKHWPCVPRWGDIKNINPAELPPAELVCGGYPCQPFSCAGERRGAEDDRHLWPFIIPIVAAVRPTWCLFENVAGHVTLGLDRVLSDLESLGYTCQTLIVPACGVGAPHRRHRVWIIAHTEHGGREGWKQEGQGAETALPFGKATSHTEGDRRGSWGAEAERFQGQSGAVGGGGHVSHLNGERCEELNVSAKPGGAGRGIRVDGWPVEPGVGRVAHGVPHRVDRLRGLGNAVVPPLVAEIGRAIMETSRRCCDHA